MVRGRILAAAALLIVGGLAAIGCSNSSSDDAGGDATTTSAAGRSTTSSTEASPVTTAPADVPAAMQARLAEELGDAEVASQVLAAVNPEALASFESTMTIEQVATTPVLSYRPPEVPADQIDSLVIFAFGYRTAADGTQLPGPANEAMATVAQDFVAEHPVPIYAQREIASVLLANGVPDVTSIEPVVGPDGTEQYLSTAGAAAQVVERAQAAGVDLGTVGVIGFADHAGRCVLTAEAAGMTAAVPAGVTLPSEYDAESAQAWTRDRVTYLATDLGSRLASA